MTFNFDNTYPQLPHELFSEVVPTKVKKPLLVYFNQALAEKLGLNPKDLNNNIIENMLSGNQLPKGAASIAQAYSGHQFGHFTTLGDGRAILIGEQITPQGDRFDLQLKGAGITPYSRRGDGRATLNAMLREYIFSEALYAMNIPTTRSLAIVATGETVYREQAQEGGILTRVASSHIRVGTFQHARQFEPLETQKALSTYTIRRHFPHLENSEQPALELLKAVIQKQINLIVHWMRVGFIHGVMNTDNMTLSGESIDFGPCAFMNAYRPDTVFSSIDHSGRYAFNQQPSIALWNLTRLAESLLPQIDTVEIKAVERVKEILIQFEAQFKEQHQSMWLKKIGIATSTAEDKALLDRLMSWMEKHKADYTNTFVQLMYPELDLNTCFKIEEVKTWISDWRKHLKASTEGSKNPLHLMQNHNPIYIPRNKMVENILELIMKENETNALHNLMEKLTQPYAKENWDLSYMTAPDKMFDLNYKTFCGT